MAGGATSSCRSDGGIGPLGKDSSKNMRCIFFFSGKSWIWRSLQTTDANLLETGPSSGCSPKAPGHAVASRCNCPPPPGCSPLTLSRCVNLPPQGLGVPPHKQGKRHEHDCNCIRPPVEQKRNRNFFVRELHNSFYWHPTPYIKQPRLTRMDWDEMHFKGTHVTGSTFCVLDRCNFLVLQGSPYG